MFRPEIVKGATQVRQTLLGKYNTELAEKEDQDEVEKLLAELTYQKAPPPTS